VTTLSSSANPSILGQPVTFTATVSAAGDSPLAWRRTVAPSQVAGDGGTLTISDGGTVLATVAVVGGQAAFTTSSLSAGTHTVTATFSGTATTAASSATIVQQVDLPPTSTTTQPSPVGREPAVLPATR
jgi:hypothetical protein